MRAGRTIGPISFMAGPDCPVIAMASGTCTADATTQKNRASQWRWVMLITSSLAICPPSATGRRPCVLAVAGRLQAPSDFPRARMMLAEDPDAVVEGLLVQGDGAGQI